MGAVSEDDVFPVEVGSGLIELVDNFTYLGSNLSSDGEATCEVKCQIAKASKAFGTLRIPLFSNCHLSIHTKRIVYNAVVISILLYGAETWTVKAPDVHLLTALHNRCVCTILDSHSGMRELQLHNCQLSLVCLYQLLIAFWREDCQHG